VATCELINSVNSSDIGFFSLSGEAGQYPVNIHWQLRTIAIGAPINSPKGTYGSALTEHQG
jgi:hypothetical protein